MCQKLLFEMIDHIWLYEQVPPGSLEQVLSSSMGGLLIRNIYAYLPKTGASAPIVLRHCAAAESVQAYWQVMGERLHAVGGAGSAPGDGSAAPRPRCSSGAERRAAAAAVQRKHCACALFRLAGCFDSLCRLHT